MVRNLLAMTRIDAGALEVRRDWTDLRELAERAASAARRRGAMQAIEVRLPDDLPHGKGGRQARRAGIRQRGRQCRDTYAAGNADLIDAKVTDKAVALRVTDDGPGIASEMLPRMFDKFVHAADAEAGSADGGEGTGLGLAIAKGIMDAHGGAIAAESPVTNGHGARIIFTFPREDIPR